MQRLIYLLSGTVFFIVLCISLVGCKKDSTTAPEQQQAITDDLFPLVPGHIIVYGEGNLYQYDTQTPIPGSETGFNSKWIVGTSVPFPVAPYTNPTIVIDTTNVPAFGVTNIRQFFIHKDTTNGNFDFLTNLGYLFRSQKIYNTPGDSSSGVRADSLVWIALSQSTAGVGNEYIAYSETYNSAALGGNIKFDIVGQFDKETLTISGTNYDTYKLTATRKIYLGTSTVAASTATTAVLWLAPNIGPIKIILIGDGESNGKIQTMTSKNF